MPMTDFLDQLATEVRARRRVLQLSQRDLAELAGVSERFVRFVEQGKRTVQLSSLLALLETLGLELQLSTRTRAAARALNGRRPDGGRVEAHPANGSPLDGEPLNGSLPDGEPFGGEL
jgi:HTH-type transcriptional regulator/antitoxin HipB